jgi:hypothetical protein
LNSCRIHPAAAAMKQHSLPIDKSWKLKEIKMGGNVSLAYASSLFPAHTFWDSHQVPRPGNRKLSVGSTTHQAHHAVPTTPLIYPVAKGRNSTRDFQPEDI